MLKNKTENIALNIVENIIDRAYNYQTSKTLTIPIVPISNHPFPPQF